VPAFDLSPNTIDLGCVVGCEVLPSDRKFSMDPRVNWLDSSKCIDHICACPDAEFMLESLRRYGRPVKNNLGDLKTMSKSKKVSGMDYEPLALEGRPDGADSSKGITKGTSRDAREYEFLYIR
jgi:hypothetical protein